MTMLRLLVVALMVFTVTACSDKPGDTRLKQLLQQQQLAASAEAVRLTQLRYQSGMADFLQLLDAERELLSARDQAARLSLANYQHMVGLYQEFAAGLAL